MGLNEQRQEPAAAPRSTPWRLPVLPPWLAVVELAVLLGLIVAVDQLVPSLDIAAMQPHPLWLPVLLLSVQYGTVSGLIAAGGAIAIFASQGFAAPDVGENLFAYLVRAWAQPVLWIAAALMLGQLRLSQLNMKQELRRQVEELTRQRDTMVAQAEALRRRCDGLERVLASRRGGGEADMMMALAGVARSPTLASALEHAALTIDADAALSVWRRDDGGLVRVLATGWPRQAAPWPVRLDASAPLAHAVCAGRALSVLARADEAALAGQGLAAVPVPGIGASGPIGMVKLERARAAALTPEVLDRLAVLAALLAGPLSAEAGARVASENASSHAMAPGGRPRAPESMAEAAGTAPSALALLASLSPGAPR